MFGLLDISTSGMIAERVRLEAISTNLANANTVRDKDGNINPFRRKIVMIETGNPDGTREDFRDMGVHVAQIQDDTTPVTPRFWDPNNPNAFKDGPFKGYVAETGINPVVENVNAVAAVRAYEANVMAAEAYKQMVASALRMIG
jgi:flagellar basal-body rod protein FlgC